MKKQMNWSALGFTFLALAIVYGVGTTFFTIELERLVERTLTPRILASRGVDTLSKEIYAGVEPFMNTRYVRLIGYTCVGLILLTSFVGLFTRSRSLANLGSFSLILPVYAYFVLHMSFLAGLGVLTALWAPFWGDLVRFGDIAYLPYMILVYPFSLLGIDIRQALAGLIVSLGLLILILGVMAWFYARSKKKITADFWIYRFTRHPQYLGWILWSYGLMLRVAFRHDTVMGMDNPGASLPWALSTLIIVCVALSEDIQMRQLDPVVYTAYAQKAPFLFPLPVIVSRLVRGPFQWIIKKVRPESRFDLVWVFLIYLVLLSLLSLPFVLLDWPPGGWANWPF